MLLLSLLLSPPVFAGTHAASVVLVSTPLPASSPPGPAPTDGSWTAHQAATLAVCGVSWRVPVRGTPALTLSPGCPDQDQDAVSKAAAGWIFGAASPATGQDSVAVQRWFTLTRSEQGALTWTAAARDPGRAALPDKCITPVYRKMPELGGMVAVNSTWATQCEATLALDATGHPTQVEVSGCPDAASLSVVDAFRGWRFKVCEAGGADDPVFQERMKMEVHG